MSKYEGYSITNFKSYLEDGRASFIERYRKKFRNRGDYVLTDFDRRRTLGHGSFGVVLAVTNVHTGQHYAMKLIEKKLIVEQKQVEHTFAEKRILQSVHFPFTINLNFFFLDPRYLYLLMPLALGGELFDTMRKMRRFNEDLAKFYAAQVIMGLEYLHYNDLVYRDLKPENLVLFENGYLKITDFGFCKIVTDRTYTLCGTPEYMAPEVLQNKGYGKSCDWWSMGVLIYEMTVGYSPFQAKDVRQTYELILAGRFKFPKSVELSQNVRHLLKHLIEPDLTRRFGNIHSGVKQIKDHPWFLNLDWLALVNQKIPPPYIPHCKQVNDGLGEPYDESQFRPRGSQTDRYSNIFKDF